MTTRRVTSRPGFGLRFNAFGLGRIRKVAFFVGHHIMSITASDAATTPCPVITQDHPGTQIYKLNSRFANVKFSHWQSLSRGLAPQTLLALAQMEYGFFETVFILSARRMFRSLLKTLEQKQGDGPPTSTYACSGIQQAMGHLILSDSAMVGFG